ncbi:hypothetical protein [Paracraurococcus lichenis]|uniref:Membrane protein 6-pyruvoyl-tetrahydropterin synthase-related domain-containing protein n=1 Tax=Paracraurococcus lichenis TaxID=3064888 RepID=A0ABT9E0M5_9PROT|nr:hypothetical protein [Paracraurococcus sp. LOR1-02]MDO9709717.1 hypothetical protein [Paracraurococcus sp. LOR1-02]
MSLPGPGRFPHVLAWGLVALAAAAGPLLAVGLPGSFASSGQDTGAALLWLHGMRAAIAQGEWWPRWLMEGNRTFGSPVFLFYPPGAYWIGSAVQAALGLDTAQALVAAALLFRLACCAFAYAWLRQEASPRAAMAGTALAALQTYDMLVNPLVRFAFAEMAGTAALFLALAAAGARRPGRWLPPAFAVVVMTHLPMAVLAGGVLPAWSAARHGLRRSAGTLLLCLLGAAMAGAYLLPALLLLPQINAAGWETGGLTTWSGHFLLEPARPPKAPVQFWLMNAGLLVMIATALLARPWRDRRLRGPALLFGALCLLMTRLSWPAWVLLPPLRAVQFPWRLMPFAVALWAVLLARRLDAPDGGGRLAPAAALAFAAAALWIPFSAVTARLPELARYDWTRLRIEAAGPRPLPSRNPPEYAPRAATRAGWRAEDAGTDALLAVRLAGAAVPGLVTERVPPDHLHVTGSLAAPASLLLPQLAFPGWAAAGTAAALATDPASGLLRLDLPAGAVDVTVVRIPTKEERIGWGVSATAIPLWLLLGWAVPRRRAAAGRNRDGEA